MRARAENGRARPISHSRMHFRDWSRKDEILIEHISNHKKTSKHQKKHRSVHVRAGAENVCIQAKSLRAQIVMNYLILVCLIR